MENLKRIDWVKWLIITLGVWLIIYPHPYKALVTILVIVPMITLFIHGIVGNRPSISALFDGVLDNKSSFSPITHFCCSFILLGFRVFMDYDPENMFVMMGVGLVSAFIPCLILLSTHKLADKKDEMAGLNYVLLGLMLLFYPPTSMFAINCVYDNTEPHTYQVKVIDKDKSRSSSKSGGDYYLKVTSWTHNSEPISIEVSSDKYSDVEEGDTVIVHARDGLFGVGWYYIEL
ncbi:MAG: hypothetical protein HOP37_09705 [Cyclobacteriaceae bacterium]|nr:hypothetical protein [Cyclobacteriaceae bacterium]